MTNQAEFRLRLSEISARKPKRLTLEPGPEELAAIASDLGLTDLRKMRFAVTLSPVGKADWRLEGHLGATVVQPCVVTLEPVTTRIEEKVERIFAADYSEPEGAEVEMPEDDSVEPLPETLDLMAQAQEALALALPPYPRKEGAEAGEAVFAAPGVTPLRDADLNPFAGLADLRKTLSDKDEPEG